MSKSWWAGVLVMGAAGLNGCAEPGPQYYPVEGVVTMNGEPVDQLRIEFWPTGAEGGKSAGNTDAQGRFVLKPWDGQGEGAVQGKHKIVVRDNSMMKVPFAGRANENVDVTQGAKPRIHGKYSNFSTTPLEVEITGPKRDLTLEIDPHDGQAPSAAAPASSAPPAN